MATVKKQTRSLATKLFVFAVGMFAFGFVVMPPMYDLICDITGLGGQGVEVVEAGEATGAIDREVKLRFDATVNSALPWDLQPQEPYTRVRLGDMSETLYVAFNDSAAPVSGQAIYTVTPPEASLYFVKTECFCFTQQTLMANETREMPVRFYVKPDLPEHIREITLSYTFFEDPSEPKIAANDPASGRQE
jgi:cytochrome c oxidase assembly protein subunit 11